MEKIRDITVGERKLLSSIKKRPGMYLGHTTLSNFNQWAFGYAYAMRVTGQGKEHNILPDGLNDYAAVKYLGHTETPLNCFHLILQQVSDEKEAFYVFFEFLDEYLVKLGYEPIPPFHNKDFNKDFFINE